LSEQKQIAPPLWLLAEITYRCPLHCVFCYNPLNYAGNKNELTTEQWKEVLRQARKLGAAQLGFSGGEPLVRDDLEELIGEAHQLGYYTNLITSGVGLTEARIAKMKELGLDHIQLSFQDSTKEMNDFLSSTKTFDLKSKVAALIKKYDYPMVLNVVLHRYNLDHVGRIIEMAVEMGVEYLELANTQYYAWASVNRDQLMPTREQLERAEKIVNEYRAKLGNKIKLLFVVPDYFEDKPKACMNGWGSVFLAVAADGSALPCHAAKSLPGLTFPNVTQENLRDIWYNSEAFNRFRGYEWMKEPCRTCDEKEKDFGGCRCQAFLVTGSAEATDPVCPKSPDRHLIDEAIAVAARTDRAPPSQPLRFVPNAAHAAGMAFRTDANSRVLAGSEPGTLESAALGNR